MAGEVKLVIAGVLCTLLVCGVYEYVFNIEENQCEMTYMFQRPNFVAIELPGEVVEKFPHYGLYVYGEGDYTPSLKKGQFNGIPVLFVPGNGGSHKQVRSLASVAYRKSLEDGPDIHFNFFTVDINEDLAALYGPALERQTEFVAVSLKRILELYKGAKIKPDSVILVGHSMGGMVGRAVFTYEGINSKIVPLVVTQATPHNRPVLMLDTHLYHFYDKVNTYWLNERSFNLKDVVLVTVGGGRNDIQVPTTHTYTPFADIATTTAHIPYCWLTADHQAVVWCRQLVLATVRALFDAIDLNTYKLTTNRTHITEVFNYHLIKRISSKRYVSGQYPLRVDIEQNSKWITIERRQHTYSATSTPRRTYLALPLSPGSNLYERATFVALALETKIWILACTANLTIKDGKDPRLCKSAVNLSGGTKKIHGKVKMVNLDLVSLEDAGYTHILINIPPSDDTLEVWMDIHSREGRSRTVNLPAFIRSFNQMLVEDTTPLKATSFNVSLHGFSELWQSFRFTVKPRGRCQPLVNPMALLYIPWANHYSYIPSRDPGVTYTAELESPPLYSNETPSIQFILSPDCTYTILVQSSIVGVFRRIVRLYGSQFPTYCSVHLLLTLAYQLKTLGTQGYCPSFFTSMLTLTPVAVVPFVKISNLILRNFEIMDDFTFMGQVGEEMALLPIFMFLSTLPLSLLLGAMTWGFILLSGHAAHSLIMRILGHSLGGTGVTIDVAMTGLTQVPVLVGMALISLAWVTCGTLALTLAAVFYFLKVFRHYELYLERMILGLIVGDETGGGKERALARLHFHLTLLILVSLVAVLNVPTLIIWARLARSKGQLEEDPSFGVCVVILLTLCVFWQKKMPNADKRWYTAVSYYLHGIAVIILLGGSIHIYRVSWAVAAALIVVALHQILAPSAPPRPLQESSAPSTDSSEAHMARLGTEGEESSGVASEASTPSFDSGESPTNAFH